MEDSSIALPPLGNGGIWTINVNLWLTTKCGLSPVVERPAVDRPANNSEVVGLIPGPCIFVLNVPKQLHPPGFEPGTFQMLAADLTMFGRFFIFLITFG